MTQGPRFRVTLLHRAVYYVYGRIGEEADFRRTAAARSITFFQKNDLRGFTEIFFSPLPNQASKPPNLRISGPGGIPPVSEIP